MLVKSRITGTGITGLQLLKAQKWTKFTTSGIEKKIQVRKTGDNSVYYLAL